MNTYPSTLRKEEKKGKRQFSRQFNITQEMKTKKKKILVCDKTGLPTFIFLKLNFFVAYRYSQIHYESQCCSFEKKNQQKEI